MKWIMKLFLLAIKLYPRQFRFRFESEMEEIFHAGLLQACEEGMLAGFILRELLQLPGSLAGVYMWSMSTGQGRQVAVSSMGGGGTSGVNTPGEGWGASFMAGLPHLLMGIIIIGTEIIYGIKGVNQNIFNYLLIIVFSLLFVGVLIFNISKGWKNWAASWIVYMFGVTIALLGVVASDLPHTIIKNNAWVSEVQVLVIPLVLAYMLYKVASRNRLRGLLAAVPPMAIIWLYFLESVPALQKSLAWGWMFLLAFTATVMMLRTKRFSVALGLAMAVPVLGGFPFVYLGVFMGGTLPFPEPGPGLQEVIRQYLPFLAMVLTIVLGPQLAVKLRAVGYESRNVGGKIFYRLALGGILLALAMTMMQWEMAISDFSIPQKVMQFSFIASAMLYLVGFVFLAWSVKRTEEFLDKKDLALQLAALFILLPFVPIVILLAIPYGIMDHTETWLLSLAEIGWVFAAAWMVKDKDNIYAAV
jgi:hypothetical protein